jgi:hypothetical protein
MTRRSIRGILGFIATAAALIGATVPAHAVDGYQETIRGIPSDFGSDGGCGDAAFWRDWGMACFVHDGDIFWIRDEAADSKSVAVQWHLRDKSRSGLIRDKLGAEINTVLNKDFPEEKWIVFRMGRCDGTATISCHYAYQYQDWTPWGCYPVDGSATYEQIISCVREQN